MQLIVKAKFAPKGWHVPSDEEWKILQIQLGMTREQSDSLGPTSNKLGLLLREKGAAHGKGQI